MKSEGPPKKASGDCEGSNFHPRRFDDIHEVLEQLQQRIAAAVMIPETILFGRVMDA